MLRSVLLKQRIGGHTTNPVAAKVLGGNWKLPYQC
jgi:hypothetical protein